MDKKLNFGQEVRRKREELKLSRAEAASRIGVAVNTLERVELRKGGISLINAVAIAKALDIPAEFIMNP